MFFQSLTFSGPYCTSVSYGYHYASPVTLGATFSKISYRQELASAILGRLDEARHQPDSLPAAFGENFVTETGATMSDFARAVKVLETHDLIRCNKVDVHGYAITEPGKAAVRIQSTPMMALVKVLLASPNNQESRASLHVRLMVVYFIIYRVDNLTI